MFELTDEQARRLAEAEFDYKMPPKPPETPKPKPLERPVHFQAPETDKPSSYKYRMKTRVRDPRVSKTDT